MLADRLWRTCSRSALLVACLVWLTDSLLVQGDSNAPPYSLNPADKTVCEIQLNLIFEAIQEYRQQHPGKLPDKLSDLTPELIWDPKILICPFVEKTGDLSSWREGFRFVGFSDPHTSYGYEFCLEKVPTWRWNWRGVARTEREFKERAKERLGKEIGPLVPLVRCFAHAPKNPGPHLNLAFNGEIYESGLYWEKERKFSDVVPIDELEPEKLLLEPPSRIQNVAKELPARNPLADSRLLDLTAHYNGLLTDSWQGFPQNDLADLPRGLCEFGSVLFDVRGVIQLSGKALPIPFSDRVDGIKVNRKLHRIHYLHGTAFKPNKVGVKIGSYVVEFADHRSVEFPLVYAQNVLDCWFDPKDPVQLLNGKIVWTGRNGAADSYGCSLRLCLTTWDNPHPELEVATVSFVSSMTQSAPFLIAITIEP